MSNNGNSYATLIGTYRPAQAPAKPRPKLENVRVWCSCGHPVVALNYSDSSVRWLDNLTQAELELLGDWANDAASDTSLPPSKRPYFEAISIGLVGWTLYIKGYRNA